MVLVSSNIIIVQMCTVDARSLSVQSRSRMMKPPVVKVRKVRTNVFCGSKNHHRGRSEGMCTSITIGDFENRLASPEPRKILS